MALTHNDIINKLAEIGESHTGIKSHYKWNLAEFFDFSVAVREGYNVTLMTYESPTVVPSNEESNLHLDWNCGFNILGKEGVETYEIDNQQAQNEVLNHCLEIAFEVMRKLILDASIPFVKDVPNPWYSVLKKLSFSFTKIGPVTANNLYGYRCEFSLNPKFKTSVDISKWK